MTAEKLEYLRVECLKQMEWHQLQARILARGEASNQDERDDNRRRSEQAAWRAEVWMQAFGVVVNTSSTCGALDSDRNKHAKSAP